MKGACSLPAKKATKKKNKCNLVVVSAPSGGGKTTICDELLKSDKKLIRSISATTRLPRGREKDGKDYHFMSASKFDRLKRQNRFLEWADVHGFYYGTLKKEVNEKIRAGKDVLLVIDVQGGLAVKKQCPEAVLVFVKPPSLDVLEKRLKGRGTDPLKVVNKRLANAKWEMKQAKNYDYHVVNDKLGEAIKDVACIISAERLKVY